MQDITIYHNPRCSKSRQTLALLEERNISPEIVLYMNDVPSRATLRELLDKLGMSAADLLRKSEPAYRDLNLSDGNPGEDQLLDAMISEPRLIQRPIVVAGDRAVLGRPPENVLELI